MQRAIHHGALSRRATPLAPSVDSVDGRFAPAIEFPEDSAAVNVFAPSGDTFAAVGETSDETSAERNEHLAVAIVQRIESRLPGRVRNLAVRIQANTVVLEGQCATYYTKQIAQHAALGILEDEHLENAIVVSVGR